MNKEIYNIFNDDVFNSIFKTLIEQGAPFDTNTQTKKPTVGKLMWKQKDILSHDTKVSPKGDLVTEIVYSIPMVFEKENPGPIKLGGIITALEDMFDKIYSNFINIERCGFYLKNDKYYIKAWVVFLDHGPSRKEK